MELSTAIRTSRLGDSLGAGLPVMQKPWLTLSTYVDLMLTNPAVTPIVSSRLILCRKLKLAIVPSIFGMF